MGTIFFRNGEFVNPVIKQHTIEYIMGNHSITRIEDGISTEITLEQMCDETCNNIGLTEDEIEAKNNRLINGLIEILKDAPIEVLNKIKNEL